MDKKAVVHLHNGILISHEEERNLTFWGIMDGPRGYYAKWSKPVVATQTPYDFIYM